VVPYFTEEHKIASVCGNKLFRKVFDLRGIKDVSNLYNKELPAAHRWVTRIITIVKSRSLRWAGYQRLQQFAQEGKKYEDVSKSLRTESITRIHAHLSYCSLKSNTKCYGDKTH